MQEETRIDSGNSNVAEFFNNQNVLITGGSGFLGRLIIEKLLRSCPDIGKLYMLMRGKKGKTPDERFKEHFDDVVYNRLKTERPDSIKKVIMIEGDTSLSDLGLTNIDREKLISNVNVVLHCAATVRFDETIRRAVSINVLGTKLLLQLAKEMSSLKAFVHVSTAYSNCIHKEIEEKFYETPVDPEKVLSLVEVLDDNMLNHLEPRLKGEWPNTYAFSKALGESIVRTNSAEMPVTIVRPSIVIPTYKDPVPGWINNYYGPTGVSMGAGIGLLRVLHGNKKNVADIIPADYVVNEIIVAAWDVAKRFEAKQKEISERDDEKTEKQDDPMIFNSVSSCQKPITWGEYVGLNEKHLPSAASTMQLWYCLFIMNEHLWICNILWVLLHTVPAAIVDALLFVTGQKPMLMKAYEKIHKFLGVVSGFSMHEWKFSDKNTLALWDRTSPTDKKEFYFHLEDLDWDDYMYKHVMGLRQYILKDPLDTIPAGKAKNKRLKIAHYVLTTVIFSLLAWGLFHFMRLAVSLFQVFTS